MPLLEVQRDLVACIFGNILKEIPVIEVLHIEDRDFLMEVCACWREEGREKVE